MIGAGLLHAFVHFNPELGQRFDRGCHGIIIQMIMRAAARRPSSFEAVARGRSAHPKPSWSIASKKRSVAALPLVVRPSSTAAHASKAAGPAPRARASSWPRASTRSPRFVLVMQALAGVRCCAGQGKVMLAAGVRDCYQEELCSHVSHRSHRCLLPRTSRLQKLRSGLASLSEHTRFQAQATLQKTCAGAMVPPVRVEVREGRVVRARHGWRVDQRRRAPTTQSRTTAIATDNRRATH